MRQTATFVKIDWYQMADEFSWLKEIGLRIPDLIAGLSGGIVNAFVFKRSDGWSIVGSVVVGALTANYLSSIVSAYTGTSSGAAAFIVGLAGMAICQGIVEAVKNWRLVNPGSKPNVPPS